MLMPQEIAALGAAAALRARQGEGACVAELAKLAASGVLESHDIADAVRASGDVPGVVLGTMAEHQPFVRAAVVAEAAKALGLSSKRDAEALGKALEDLEKAMQPGHDVHTASQAIADSLMAQQRRDNLSMAEDARRTWLKAVGDAVPKAARGELSYEECVRQVVETMARRGVKVIDYRSGIRVSPDVAARRHIVTQVQQAASSRSFEASEAMGEGLVFVSSHVGARPSHREWQGKPYACHGPLTIDGVTYDDLADATGYGTAGGLCGANCRHSFGPWLHWQEPRWSATPDEDAGLDPDEAYKATQAQRANEREIRAQKLRADALRGAGQDDSEARLALGRAQARQRKLLADNHWLKRRPERERAYGAGGRAVDVKPLKKASEAAVEEKFISSKAMGTAFDVSRHAVNGNAYREKYVTGLGVGKKAGMQLYADAREILRETDGTAFERITAVSAKSGRRITDSFSADPHEFKANLTDRQRTLIAKEEGGVILLHNHPGSSLPSPADIISASDANVAASVIACHDGTVYKLTCDEPGIGEIYNRLRDMVKRSAPWESNANIIENKAMDMLYEENGAERWFKVEKL